MEKSFHDEPPDIEATGRTQAASLLSRSIRHV